MQIKARNDQRTEIGMIIEKETIGTAKKIPSKLDEANGLEWSWQSKSQPPPPGSHLQSACTNQNITQRNENSHLNFYLNLVTNMSHQITVFLSTSIPTDTKKCQ